MTDPLGLMSYAQLAAWTGAHERTVDRWWARQRMPRVLVRGVRKIDRDSFVEWARPRHFVRVKITSPEVLALLQCSDTIERN